VTNTPGGPLPAYDPFTPTNPDNSGAPVDPSQWPGYLGNYGQNPVSGIDTSTPNPEDPGNATTDWWNQLNGE
jgi:hypothetical protein